MRILHYVDGRCNPQSANGVDKTVYYQTRTLAQLGHDVLLISMTEKDTIPIDGVEIVRIRRWNPLMGAPTDLIEIVTEFSPHIGHLHSAYVPHNINLAKVLRGRGVPYVVTAHGNLSNRLLDRRGWVKRPYKLLLERPYANRACFIHAVGDESEIRRYGVTAPIVDIPNGFDPHSIPQVFDTGVIEARVPSFGGKKVFVYIGRLDVEQKGLDHLLEACARLDDPSDEIRVLLVGPSWKDGAARLQSMAADLQLGDRVHFWGSAYGVEKYDILRAAYAFIQVSRWEGFSFSVIDALACGKPCILTREADPNGLVEQHAAGEIVAGDPPSIAEGLQAVARLTEEMRVDWAGREKEIVAGLNWQTIGLQLIEAYRRCRGE